MVETLRSAARHALATAAPASAVRYLQRVLREPPPAEARAAMLGELGHAEAVAGRTGAVEHLESAIELAASAVRRAELLLAFGRALHHGGRLLEACDAFRRGLDQLTAGRGDPAHTAGRAFLLSLAGPCRARWG